MTKPIKHIKPAGFSLANPVPPTKWEAQREKERITLQDHQTIPHLNSTMGGRYEGKELDNLLHSTSGMDTADVRRALWMQA